MKNEMNMPLTYWIEAVHTAIHIMNQTPIAAIHEISPYERFYGIKPIVSYMKFFGIVCYVHVPNEARKKMEPNAMKCIFLGYLVEKKGYKCYDPTTRKVYVSRDVRFCEHEPWYKPKPVIIEVEYEEQENVRHVVDEPGPSTRTISRPHMIEESTGSVNPWSGRLQDKKQDEKGKKKVFEESSRDESFDEEHGLPHLRTPGSKHAEKYVPPYARVEEKSAPQLRRSERVLMVYPSYALGLSSYPDLRGRPGHGLRSQMAPCTQTDFVDQVSTVSATEVSEALDGLEDEILSADLGQRLVLEIDEDLASEENNLQIVLWNIQEEVAFGKEGYMQEKGAFIVSLWNCRKEKILISDDIKNKWDAIWKDINDEFEQELSNYRSYKSLGDSTSQQLAENEFVQITKVFHIRKEKINKTLSEEEKKKEEEKNYRDLVQKYCDRMGKEQIRSSLVVPYASPLDVSRIRANVKEFLMLAAEALPVFDHMQATASFSPKKIQKLMKVQCQPSTQAELPCTLALSPLVLGFGSVFPVWVYVGSSMLVEKCRELLCSQFVLTICVLSSRFSA
ncbi:hypothetical protein L7F22_020642 [Adiantum nelumboides]|nr:hypothetical protein [Adiantum nelumboides]